MIRGNPRASCPKSGEEIGAVGRQGPWRGISFAEANPFRVHSGVGNRSPCAIPPDSQAMTTSATSPKVCPNCGVQLPDIPLSLCAYCAMPIGLATEAKSEDGESPNAPRIAKVEGHDQFAEALAFVPPEGPAYTRGGQLQFRGRMMLTLGVSFTVAVVASTVAVDSGFGVGQWILVVLGVLAIAWGVSLHVRGSKVRKEAVAAPLLSRAGLILDRRSETELDGLTGRTTYYFDIELSGGMRGEFAWPGRGAHEDPYPSNLPGVAYTRGKELLQFRHIRV